jgi:hypothetical protein
MRAPSPQTAAATSRDTPANPTRVAIQTNAVDLRAASDREFAVRSRYRSSREHESPRVLIPRTALRIRNSIFIAIDIRATVCAARITTCH